jgi:hypothetical protein
MVTPARSAVRPRHRGRTSVISPHADELVVDVGGAKWLDLLMLALAGGRERTAHQWRALLADAGWRATRVGDGVIEAQPTWPPHC